MKAGRRLAPMIAGVAAGVALMLLSACAGVTPTSLLRRMAMRSSSGYWLGL